MRFENPGLVFSTPLSRLFFAVVAGNNWLFKSFDVIAEGPCHLQNEPLREFAAAYAPECEALRLYDPSSSNG